jgi:NAD(P)H-dependent flavin oxidoreductase YrpB (nitropropane dioxygenase family)
MASKIPEVGDLPTGVDGSGDALRPDPAGVRAFETRASKLLGVRYPIVQTGMGWVSGASLTAATSSAGGFGILAASTMSYAELEGAIGRVKERTSKPFGLNFSPELPDLGQRIDLTIAQKVPVVSFAGAPTHDIVKKLHDGGVRCIATVGAQRHAQKVAELGIDAVIAQGAEGGGHTGVVPTSLLISQVVDAVGSDIPVLAAGGIHDGRGFVAALALGADGVAMGTRFLLTKESHVPDAVKLRYLQTGVFDTVVTKSIDGRPQRVIRTPVIDRLERTSRLFRATGALRSAIAFRKLGDASFGRLMKSGVSMHHDSNLSWSQVVMAANAPMLTKAALVDGREDAGILPTGQVVGVIEELISVSDLIDEIIHEALECLARIEGLVHE